LGPRPSQTGQDPLSDARTLELSNRTEDVQLELAGRRSRINPFCKADESDTERLELLEEHD
jgi:hypothetical protein